MSKIDVGLRVSKRDICEHDFPPPLLCSGGTSRIKRARRHSSTNNFTKQLGSVADESPDALHRACKNPKVTIDEIIRLTKSDPIAATRRIILKSKKTVVPPGSYRCEKKLVKEVYGYPLHLAIHYNASLEVVTRLAEVAPSVLAKKDGLQEETPLMVLLKKPSHLVNIDLINFLILEDPLAVRLKDKQENTVLHKAIAGGVRNVEILKHLLLVFPVALHQQNFHKATPLRMCQQRTASPEEVLDFLLEKTMQEEEGTATPSVPLMSYIL